MALPPTYVNFQTPAIDAGNLNDLNIVNYTLLGNGVQSPVTRNEILTNLGISGAWTPAATGAVTSSVGTITTAAGTIRYKIIGKTVDFQATITVTTNNTGAGTLLVAGLLPIQPTATLVLSGKEVGVSNKAVTCVVAASSLNGTIVNYDNTYPAASGAIVVLNGVYESI